MIINSNFFGAKTRQKILFRKYIHKASRENVCDEYYDNYDSDHY